MVALVALAVALSVYGVLPCSSALPGVALRRVQVNTAGGGVKVIAFLQLVSTTVPPPGRLTYTDTVTVADLVNVWLTAVAALVVVTAALPSPKLYTNLLILA